MRTFNSMCYSDSALALAPALLLCALCLRAHSQAPPLPAAPDAPAAPAAARFRAGAGLAGMLGQRGPGFLSAQPRGLVGRLSELHHNGISLPVYGSSVLSLHVTRPTGAPPAIWGAPPVPVKPNKGVTIGFQF